MTFIGKENTEARVLELHKFPCEELRDLEAHSSAYKEFAEMDYATRYAEEKGLTVQKCPKCFPQENAVHYLKEFIDTTFNTEESNSIKWGPSDYGTWSKDISYEFSQTSPLYILHTNGKEGTDTRTSVIYTICCHADASWSFNITITRSDIPQEWAYGSLDEKSKIMVLLKVGKNCFALDRDSVSFLMYNPDDATSGQWLTYEISEGRNAEKLSAILNGIITDETQTVQIFVTGFNNKTEYVIGMSAIKGKNLVNSFDFSLGTMYNRLRNNLYFSLKEWLSNIPEFWQFFSDINADNVENRISEILLLSSGIKETVDNNGSKFMQESDKTHFDFLEFAHKRKKEINQTRLDSHSGLAKAMVLLSLGFECLLEEYYALFTYPIIELILTRRHICLGGRINYEELIYRMNNPTPDSANPKSPIENSAAFTIEGFWL